MRWLPIQVAAEGAACACGSARVLLLREPRPEGELLADNMGSDLATELYAGPLCPRCEPQRLAELRERIRAGQPPPTTAGG